MPTIPFPRQIQGLPTTGQIWTYKRRASAKILDIGVVHGCQVGLPVHFHDEDQLVFVAAGQRRFVIGGTLLCVRPGQSVCIAAGTPHRSLAEDAEVLCLNVYLAPGSYHPLELRRALAAWWQASDPAWESLVAAVEAHCFAPSVISQLEGYGWPTLECAPTVQQAAAAAGMSREGYSRRFLRLHGVPPETHGLLSRANAARRSLRHGVPVAQVAAEAGFSDQSHLGRVFRRLFGVTPGTYRSG